MSSKNILLCCLFLTGALFIGSIAEGAPIMVDKNLFAQDRKAPSPESATAAAQPNKAGMPITNLQLDGVMINGGTKKALIRMKSQGGAGTGADRKKQPSPYVTVREGQQVGDFRVSKIEAKSIALEKDGQTYQLNLFAEGKIAPPATAAPPAAGPPPDAPGAPPLPPGMPPNFAPPGNPAGANAPDFRRRGVRMPGQDQQQALPAPGAPVYNDPNFMQAAPPGEPQMAEPPPDQGVPEEEEESQ